MQFSDTTFNTGIVEQTRDKARVDSGQWATSKIVNSCNNWLNHIFTRGKVLDRKFQLDDTNHTALPEGTTALVSGQASYSFLTDQQGNRITNLTAVSLIEIATNIETKLYPIDLGNSNYNFASFAVTAGTPTRYDKVADNIIRFDLVPNTADAAKYKIKYYFQRAPSYFVAADTTKQPGVADDLHEGFVVKSAYDAAYTLGLSNLPILTAELAKQEQVIDDYFASRETDEPNKIIPKFRRPR